MGEQCYSAAPCISSASAAFCPSPANAAVGSMILGLPIMLNFWPSGRKWQEGSRAGVLGGRWVELGGGEGSGKTLAHPKCQASRRRKGSSVLPRGSGLRGFIANPPVFCPSSVPAERDGRSLGLRQPAAAFPEPACWPREQAGWMESGGRFVFRLSSAPRSRLRG